MNDLSASSLSELEAVDETEARMLSSCAAPEWATPGILRLRTTHLRVKRKDRRNRVPHRRQKHRWDENALRPPHLNLQI